ncbi:BTAD domain-containing putative transcriptional regulator [Streptomyces sp. NPDC005648]|uniref:AfsR/SARP family transcriptional regulator n=1 Tax=Streptomyces sp. NPDC005648 TaxID=3157044 RepID=UPI0033A0F3F1
MGHSELTAQPRRRHPAPQTPAPQTPAPRTPALARLRLFGAFGLEDAGGSIPVPANEQRLLAYLGLHRRAPRSVVAGTLWPDVTEEHAQGSLRTTLWRLRRTPHPAIGSDGDILRLADGVHVDVDDFTGAALRLAGPAHETDGTPPPLGLLDRGELLPGWDEEWICFERERLRQLRLHALESLSAWHIRRGSYALALEAALTCVAIEPLRESAHHAVVSVHLAEHNVVEAMRHYEVFRRLLRDELGIEPSTHLAAKFPHRPEGGARGPSPLAAPPERHDRPG